MFKKILLSSLVTLLSVSCTHEYKQLTIKTSPEGATIRINGEVNQNKTPFTTQVKQRENVAIVAEKEGFVTTTRKIEPETDKFLAIVWTKTDERTRYIKEDEVYIAMKKIEEPKFYKPTELPAYNAPFDTSKGGSSKQNEDAPSLRPMPKF